MSTKERELKFANAPLMVLEGGFPSSQNIDRWREYVLRESNRQSHQTINAIFDCAVLGSAQALDIEKEVNKRLKAKLSELATAIGRSE